MVYRQLGDFPVTVLIHIYDTIAFTREIRPIGIPNIHRKAQNELLQNHMSNLLRVFLVLLIIYIVYQKVRDTVKFI